MSEHPSPNQPTDFAEYERVFKALGDSTRATILRTLLASKSSLSVTEIATRIGQEHATVSAALQKLLHAGLVECAHSGKHHQYSTRLELLRERIDWALRSIIGDAGAAD
jgi:DNA-binding transcriptional ArsR family regulator